MSTIRRQSIISSLVVYFGFALGLLNTYLFTRQGGFTEQQYGLTNTFIAFASIMFSVGGFGMTAYVIKFFPYYQSHLSPRENDQLSWALLFPSAGIVVVCLLGLAFKNILVDRIFNNSPELLNYYYWTFPFAFGYTLFMILEAFAWQHRKAVMSNTLREVLFRFIVTILIVSTTVGLIRDFDTFIGIYSFIYIVLAVFLLQYFIRKGMLHFNFSMSRVTKKFYHKIIVLVSFFWGGGIIFNLASVFDGIVIAAVLPDGMKAAGIFYLAQNISSLMQAPQRAVISAATGPLSQSWKDKDYPRINRIYHRSSINQLIFSCAMFCLIWLNFEDGVHSFHLRETYIQAKWIFFFLGLSKIVDMGTGVNAQIISTSTFWRFEFVSGLILLSISLPLNYLLTRSLGVVGPGVSNLIAFTIYNSLRYGFLWKKFNMQPFTWKSLLAILLAGGCYFLTFRLFNGLEGFGVIALRSLFFILLFGAGMLSLKLSPDVQPVWLTMKKRLGL
jgi:O-antigen/teichoic acid export membrane protein